MKRRTTIQKAAVTVILLTIIVKLLGFGRELVLAYFFSASEISDAYLLASDIVTILFGWITSFSVVYIPIYSSVIVKEGKEKGLVYTWKVVTIVVLFSIGAIILIQLFPNLFVSLTANGLGLVQREYVSEFLKISIFSIGFSALSELFISYLNLNEAYAVSNSAGIPFNLVEIAAIVLAGVFHAPIVMALGVVVGNVAKMIFAYLSSRRRGLCFIKERIEKKEYMKETWIMFIPVFLSNMLIEINTLIDKTFASYLEIGSVTVLNYGAVTRRFIFNIFSVVISSVFFPKFSSIIAENDREEAKTVFEKIISSAITVFVPITFVVIFFSNDIIRVLFDRGAFLGQVSEVTVVFSSYCVGLTAMIVNELCSRAAYSFKNSRIPMVVGISTIFFNLLCNGLLVTRYGTVGLAFATSLSQILVTPIYFILIRKRLLAFKIRSVIKNIVQTVMVCSVLISIYWQISKISFIVEVHTKYYLVTAAVGSCLYLVAYFIILLLMKNTSIIEIIYFFRLKRGNRR